MNTSLVTISDDFTKSLTQLDQMNHMCAVLLETPHYKRIGPVDMFAIITKARSLNIDVIDAVNGALYCIHGKVEMTSQMMNQLIRQAGHSVTKDPKSNDEICILHGKRADTLDTWTEHFSMQEAKRANILKDKSAWHTYPRDMLFARALSRLARQLFPDVIKGCYVRGEIDTENPLDGGRQYDTSVPTQVIESETVTVSPVAQEIICPEQSAELDAMLLDCKLEFQKEIRNFCAKYKYGDNFESFPMKLYERLKARISQMVEENKEPKPEDTVLEA